MAKSKILKELANNDITLDKALKRLMLLANDLGDTTLMAWAEKELSGYESTDEIPKYRIIYSTDFIYSGINGRFQIMNQPLPLQYLNGYDDLDSIFKFEVREPIAVMNERVRTDNLHNTLQRDFTNLTFLVYNNTKRIQCTSIYQNFEVLQFAGIIEKLYNILLKVFMKLDKEYGNLDELDFDTTKIGKEQIIKTADEIKQIIYNITINNTDYSSAKIKGSNIVDGDNNNQTHKKEKKKVKDSNIGSGSNITSKTTEISPALEIDGIFKK